MKRYLFLILAAIFCLPSIGFAQDYDWTRDPWHRISNVTPESTWLETAPSLADVKKSIYNSKKKNTKKQSFQVPAVDIHKAIEIVTDETTGKTTVCWKDGSTFVGEIYYGEIKGMGTMTFVDGAKYHGQWRFDRFHGVGSMVCADGSKYTGEWQLGKPHGKGTFINPEGVAFIGEFYDGAPNGKGIIQDVDGRKYTARWKDGKLKEKSIKPLEEK